MSGRGRDINMPAWLRQKQQQEQAQYQRRSRSPPPHRSRSRSPPKHYRNRSPPRDYHNRRRSRSRSPPSRYRSSSSRHENYPPRRRGCRGPYHPRRGEIYFENIHEEREWLDERRRKRFSRKSKFDIPPEEGAEDARDAIVQPIYRNVPGGGMQPQQTRHARRLYIGQLPLDVSEAEVHKFFREAIFTAMGVADPDREEDPILSVYINRERRFAFIEFKTMEVCSACLALDGIDLLRKGKVKVKRPNDYNPALATGIDLHLPKFDVSKLGIVSGSVPDGPNKIFIGGLPYHLTDDQVMELLRAFGPIRAFHLVKADANATTSKGYCFVEYADANVTPVAIMGLNGMDMGGGKVLSARMASARGPEDDELPSTPAASNVVGGVDVEALLNVAFAGSGTLPAEAPPVTTTHAPPQQQQPQQQQPQQQQATRILVLSNMVMDEDLQSEENHAELVEEVQSECKKFGQLLTMKIPRPQDGYAATSIRKIYLEYASANDAINAEKELGGRKFGPNTVETSYFLENDYLLGNLY